MRRRSIITLTTGVMVILGAILSSGTDKRFTHNCLASLLVIGISPGSVKHAIFETLLQKSNGVEVLGRGGIPVDMNRIMYLIPPDIAQNSVIQIQIVPHNSSFPLPPPLVIDHSGNIHYDDSYYTAPVITSERVYINYISH